MLRHHILGQTFLLHPLKAMLWEEHSILLVSDLHLGKAQHFRKAGIPVPQEVKLSNFEKLRSILIDLKPKRLLILGDLFHSEINNAWDEMVYLSQQFVDIKFELVIGNHDILEKQHYEDANIKVHYNQLTLEPFLFTHHPLELEEIPDSLFNLCGHLHPAVRMYGKARQSLRLACFYFGQNQGVLPAFGEFTGMSKLKVQKDDEVYVISEQEVIKVA